MPRTCRCPRGTKIADAVTAAIQQAVDLRLGNGSAVHQDDVASHSQSRRGLRQTHRLCECRAVGHQRRRTYDALFVGLDDGTIHARCETKIVSVDDQPAHRASLAGMCEGCRMTGFPECRQGVP